MEKREEDMVLVRGYRHVETRWGLRPWHRIVCSRAHGKIPDEWVVHHIDAVKLNNKPENLIALPRKMHDTIHQLIQLPTREELNRMLDGLKEGKRLDRDLLQRQRERIKSGELKRQAKAIKGKKRRRYRSHRKAVAKTSVSDFVKNNPEKVRIYEPEYRNGKKTVIPSNIKVGETYGR